MPKIGNANCDFRKTKVLILNKFLLVNDITHKNTAVAKNRNSGTFILFSLFEFKNFLQTKHSKSNS